MKPAATYTELEKQITMQLIKAVQNEIAQFIKSYEQSRIDIDVYQAYDKMRGGYDESRHYERTYELKEDISISKTPKGAIVSNNSHDDNILKTIETGLGYTWKNSLIYKTKMPRSFFDNTTKDIESGKLNGEIKDILIKNGFKII